MARALKFFGPGARATAKQILWECVGSMLIAVGIYNFAAAAKFPMTGFSGIAIIVNRLTGMPIGVTTILLNVPVAALCYKLLGRRFFISSLRCMVISSVFIDVLAPMLPVYEGERLLAALCTGIFGGLGYALIYIQNSSTGGSDFIIMAVKAMRPHIPLGKIAFLSDVGIILAGGVIFGDIDGIIYGMIVNYIFAIAVDKVMYGMNAGKMALIVTDDAPRICREIDRVSRRGSTIIPAKGGYQGAQRQVVMCACSGKEMYQIQKTVRAADPQSFLIVLDSSEVHGEGFRPVQIGG